MPIALLPELTATLLRAGRVLQPWTRLVAIEELILRRARGAFLTQWFGPRVPVRQLNLLIVVANVAELRRRYLEVRRSLPGTGPEINLLGPLAGITGLLLGFLFSPTGAVFLASHAQEAFSTLVGGETGGGILALLYRVLGIWIMPALGPALGILALPVLALAALGFAAGGDPAARGVYMLLGEAALLLEAVTRWWDVVTGPRSEIRNPLLRRILRVLDRFAALFAQVLGFVALLVSRVVPLLPSLVAQFRALGDLVSTVFDALGDIFRDLRERLVEPFVGSRSVVPAVVAALDAIVELPAFVTSKAKEFLSDARSDLVDALAAIVAAVGTFVDALAGQIETAFGQTLVGRMVERVQALLGLAPDLREAFTAEAEPDAGDDTPAADSDDDGDSILRNWFINHVVTGGLTGALADLFDSFGDVPIPDFPDLALPEPPSLPGLPDLGAIGENIGGRPQESLSATAFSEAIAEQAEGLVPAPDAEAILANPPSAFATERRDLERTLGRPRLDLGDARLRDLIYLAVGRVLPPALRLYAPNVRQMFDSLDREVYGEDPSSEPFDPQHPMLELDDSGRLRPVVQVLTVRSTGGFAPDLRAFRDLLVEEIQGRTYLATEAGG